MKRLKRSTTSHMEHPNVRFWWGRTKITMEPEQLIKYECGGRHEEGWWHNLETLYYDAREHRVVLEAEHSGADCDGPLSSYSRFECMVDNLHDHWNEYVQAYQPNWKKVSSRQRDVFAERMGY